MLKVSEFIEILKEMDPEAEIFKADPTNGGYVSMHKEEVKGGEVVVDMLGVGLHEDFDHIEEWMKAYKGDMVVKKGILIK